MIRGAVGWVVCSPRRILLVMVVDLLACGWTYSLLEHKGPVEGPWWGIVTGSTVGYGDFYPQSTAGRGVAAFLICSMVLLLALFTAQVTAWAIPDPHVFTDEEQRHVIGELAAVREQQARLLAQQQEILARLTSLAEPPRG